MQGPNYLDLAKNIADEHYDNRNPHAPARSASDGSDHKARQWAGRKLIQLGERLVPKPTELQLKVSTGPPCP